MHLCLPFHHHTGKAQLSYRKKRRKKKLGIDAGRFAKPSDAKVDTPVCRRGTESKVNETSTITTTTVNVEAKSAQYRQLVDNASIHGSYRRPLG